MTIRDQPNWQPISMLPTITGLIDGGLEDATGNVRNLREVHQREYGTLDEHTVARFIAYFTEGLEFLPIYTEQLQRWQRSNLTEPQRREVTRLQGQLPPLKAAHTEGLNLANDMQQRTIEKVMAKSDLELGLDALVRIAGPIPTGKKPSR